FFAIHDILLNFTIAFAIIMVMLCTTLISEFTSVLFDQRDNHIILVRPISNRTLLLSRLLHIQFYLMFIGLALAAISTIVTIFKFGILAAIFYLIGVLQCTWISILFTSLFYILISKFVSGERFKDIITYVQIFLAIIIMGGYQLIPRMMDIDGISNFTMQIKPYTYLVPPAWLSAWVKLSIPNGLSFQIVMLTIPAFIFTAVGGLLLVRFLSGGFANILSQTGETTTTTKKSNTSAKPATGFHRFFCTSAHEKTGWNLALAMTKRDRKFKQAVYPAYGFMIVMAIVLLKPDFNNLSQWYAQLADSSRYLMFIFFGFFAANCVDQVRYTDTPEASWVYKALPIASPGHILSGAIKAVLIKYFVPIYVLLISAATIIWGFHILPLMILGAILIISTTLISVVIQKTALPFSQPREMQQKGSNFLKIMMGTIIMGVLIGFVYLASFFPNWLVCLLALMSAGGNMLIYKYIRGIQFNM
ncbi:MAG TPA: hypothetical protein VHO72_14915, partial [Bacteroidales bacterium]|nr:hypothetical protein [Bacteroidales bacterium]